MYIIAEIKYDVHNPTGDYTEPLRQLVLIYDKNKKKWIIENDSVYYGLGDDKPKGKPIVTKFD